MRISDAEWQVMNYLDAQEQWYRFDQGSGRAVWLVKSTVQTLFGSFGWEKSVWLRKKTKSASIQLFNFGPADTCLSRY